MDGARGMLMDILANYQGFLQMSLILVFDAYKVSGGQGENTRYHNIHVVYTQEAETADEYIEKTVPILKGLGPVEQDIYIRRLASEFGISESAIHMAVQTGGDNNISVNKVSGSAVRERAARESARKYVFDRSLKSVDMSFCIHCRYWIPAFV
jgi:predicted RNA-binding protein with PIN domain